MVVIVDERSHVAVLYLIYRSVKSSNAQFKVEGLFYFDYETRIGRHNLKDSQWLFFTRDDAKLYLPIPSIRPKGL